MSATCCIVALSSTHKTILLTWVLPKVSHDAAAKRVDASLLVSWASKKGQNQLPEIRGLFAVARRVIGCPTNAGAI